MGSGVYNEPMKRVNYHLTDGQIAKLRALSERTGLTVAELIRRFVDEGLKAEERKAKKEGR